MVFHQGLLCVIINIFVVVMFSNKVPALTQSGTWVPVNECAYRRAVIASFPYDYCKIIHCLYVKVFQQSVKNLIVLEVDTAGLCMTNSALPYAF